MPCSTQSLLVEKFSRGCLIRLGHLIKQQQDILSDVLLTLLHLLDEELGIHNACFHITKASTGAYSVQLSPCYGQGTFEMRRLEIVTRDMHFAANFHEYEIKILVRLHLIQSQKPALILPWFPVIMQFMMNLDQHPLAVAYTTSGSFSSHLDNSLFIKHWEIKPSFQQKSQITHMMSFHYSSSVQLSKKMHHRWYLRMDL